MFLEAEDPKTCSNKHSPNIYIGHPKADVLFVAPANCVAALANAGLLSWQLRRRLLHIAML